MTKQSTRSNPAGHRISVERTETLARLKVEVDDHSIEIWLDRADAAKVIEILRQFVEGKPL